MTFVLGLTGSLRKGSYSTAMLRAATRNLPQNVRMEIADISNIPLYNKDLEAGGRAPDAVRTFRDDCTKADAFLFAIPEHTFGVPGPLKNALDWTFRSRMASGTNLFAGKVCAVVGVGTVNEPHYYMRIKDWAESMQMKTLDHTIYVNKNSVTESAFDANGNLVAEEVNKDLRKLIEEIVAKVNQSKR